MGILGKALHDYYGGNIEMPLVVQCDRAPDEVMLQSQFFFPEEEMTKLDKTALQAAKGRILDVGAGAGRHTLALQEKGYQVVALEADEDCASLCRLRGVEQVAPIPWQAFTAKGEFDTTIALMNGLGLCGTHKELSTYLRWHCEVLDKGGKIIVDTSSVAYLKPAIDKTRRRDEVYFRFLYEGEVTEWFSWLFAEKAEAVRQLRRVGFINVICLFQEPTGRYLLTAEKKG